MLARDGPLLLSQLSAIVACRVYRLFPGPLEHMATLVLPVVKGDTLCFEFVAPDDAIYVFHPYLPLALGLNMTVALNRAEMRLKEGDTAIVSVSLKGFIGALT